MLLPREIRYQGAIVKDDYILLIRYREYETDRTYWLFPGGGIEPGESAEDCVRREMYEETHLTVQVERLLADEAHELPEFYQRRHTYLCSVVAGEAKPGHEPELEIQPDYGIVEVGWFDLRDSTRWGAARENPRTYGQLLRLQVILGYPVAELRE